MNDGSFSLVKKYTPTQVNLAGKKPLMLRIAVESKEC